VADEQRERVLRAWRRLVKAGAEPTFLIELDPPRVVDLPWIEFYGRRPAEAAEAARRSVAAAIGVRPTQVRVAIMDAGQRLSAASRRRPADPPVAIPAVPPGPSSARGG
jgi:hypothetical protein